MIRPALLRLGAASLILIALLLVAAGCGDDSGSGGSADDDTTEIDSAADVDEDVAARNDSYDEPPSERLDPDRTYTVRMETNKGTFDIDVDPDAAPIAAANFVFLVEEGFYDGIVFHRVIEDFMVQAGDPLGDGTGGPGYQLQDDPVKGDYDRGIVAMANAGPNTGGSQFFIVHGSTVELPKDYVIFGSVDGDGMKVVDEIAAVEVEPGPTGEPSSPVERIVIERAFLVDGDGEAEGSDADE